MSAKIGKEKRMPILNNWTPGPGEYQSTLTQDTRGAKFGTGKRPKQKKCSGPGPGAYNIGSTLYEKPGKTIAGKRRSQSIDWVPGPGSYNIKMDRGVSCSLKGRYGKDFKLWENKCKPAPGAYSPRYDLVLPFIPGKTIAGKRKNKFNDWAPGPGTYNIKPEKGIAYSIQGKFNKDHELCEKKWKPGPGAYDPDYKITQAFSPGKTIAGKRKVKECDGCPGPGTYLIVEGENNKGWTMAHRPKSADVWKGPGPGAYDIKTTLCDKPGKSIAGKKVETFCAENPGPGAYDPKIEKGIAYSIQGKYRDNYEQNENNSKPGPNSYYPSYNLARPHNPGKSIGMKYNEKHLEEGPGPGAYKFYDWEKKDGGWTIGHRPKSAESAKGPGPGAYDIKTTLCDKPGKTIAGKREHKSADDGPGPGMYDPKLDKGLAYTIQGKYKSSYEDNENQGKPGPSYYPNVNLVKPHYPGKSIAGKRNSIEKFDDLPGPGMYDPKLDKGLAFSIQGRHNKDFDMLESTKKPGPNTYYPNVNLTHPHNPGKSIGMRYPGDHQDDIPGPGAYKFYDQDNKGKGWTIAHRLQSANPDQSPGPAAYDIKTTIHDKPGKSIAGKPHDKAVEDIPGPGMYNPKLDGGPAFTIQGKYQNSYEMSELLSKPGPNAYYPNVDPTKPNNPGKTIAGRYNEKLFDDGPGPGLYDPKLDRGIAYSIQGRYGKDYDMLENMKKPGPNAYNPNYDPIYPHNPGKSMGSRYKDREFDEIPGPGSYKYYNFDDEGKGWTMAHRPKTADDFRSPGPAAYYPDMKSGAPAYTIASGFRLPYNSEGGPGPNQYDSKILWDKGPIIGKERRIEGTLQPSKEPGPGAYDRLSQFETQGRGVYMAGRYPEKGYMDIPGPGAYEQKDQRPGPHYSLSGTRKETQHDLGPGPAQYDIDRWDNTVYNSRSGAKFNSGGRDTFSKIDTPGPGTYYYIPNKTGGVSMGWRYPQKQDWRSPGPAAYDQNWKTIQSVVDTQHPHPMSGSGGIDFYGKSGNPGPGTYDVNQQYSTTGGKIGDGTRTEGKQSDAPGPGKYYSPHKFDTTSVVFGSEKRNKQYSTDTPGPGYYYVPWTVADVPRYVMPVQEERYKWV